MVSTVMIHAVWPVPWSTPRRFVFIGASKRCSWWPWAGRFGRWLASLQRGRGRSITGCGATCVPISRSPCTTRRARDARRRPGASPMPGSCASCGATRCAWATIRPAGPYPCSPNTSVKSTAARSRHARCAAGYTGSACDGNGRAMSTPLRTRTVPRKKGDCPPPEGEAARRRPALRGRDRLALVPAAAMHLGVSWGTGRRPHYRSQCQAGAVRRCQSPHRAPPRLAPLPAAPGGLSGLLALFAPALPRSADLAAAGQGTLPRCRPEPTAGGTLGDRAGVAAQAVLRTQRGGPPLEGIETAHRCQSSIPNHRRRSRARRTVVPRADAPRSAAEGGRPLGKLLAQGLSVKTSGYLLRGLEGQELWSM